MRRPVPKTATSADLDGHSDYETIIGVFVFGVLASPSGVGGRCESGLEEAHALRPETYEDHHFERAGAGL